MAVESLRQKLRREDEDQELTCFVCQDVFREPLILGCRHRFCRACVAQGWRESPADAAAACCPRCGEAAQPSRGQGQAEALLLPLAGFADGAKQLGGHQAGQEAGGGGGGARGLCERHREPLKLFCEDDGALLCLVCTVCRLHRDHRVVPMEEAAQEYQEQICVCLENLRKRRETILFYQSNTETESQELLKLNERERQKTVTEFRELHQLLKVEENRLLAQMEEVDKKIVKKREEHMLRLSEELSSLDGLIQELEDKCQQMARELLEDGASIFQRCKQKEKLENPMALLFSLKWKVWEFCDINSILTDVMNNFKDSLKDEHPQRKANVFAKRRLLHHFRQLLMDPVDSRRRDENPASSSCDISARNDLLGSRAPQENSTLGSLPTNSPQSFEGLGQNCTPLNWFGGSTFLGCQMISSQNSL